MNEQSARELELRNLSKMFIGKGKPASFVGDESKANTYVSGALGVMTSYNRIGLVASSANKGVQQDIIRGEWGFRGYAVTDIYDDFDIYGAVLTSGATCYDTRGMAGFYTNTTLDGGRFSDQVDGSTINAVVFAGDANAQNAIKASVHKILYAMSQSNLMNRYDASTHVVKLPVFWRTAYQNVEAASGAMMAAFAFLYLVNKLRKKEGK
jgi:beta-glucosidase